MRKALWKTLLALSAIHAGPLVATESVRPAAAMAFTSGGDASSARAVALGSTYVGIAEGSATLPWNTAGLASQTKPEASLNHNSTLIGSFRESALIAWPLRPGSAVGASLSYGDSGKFEGRDDSGYLTSDYGSSSYGASLGWGFRAPAQLAFGAAIKFGHQTLADKSVDALSGDLGALWTPSPTMNVGVAYNGLGFDVAGSHLEQGLSIGVSKYLQKGQPYEWLLAVSTETYTFGGTDLHLGLESNIHQLLSLRAGYSIGVIDADSAQGLQGLSLGLGVKVHALSLDYAFVPMDVIGDLHRLSLTYEFGDRAATN